MDADIIWLIVYLLLGLAVLDLMVGVSNDAVNFLNSAFGSRVARRRTILIIASLGIILGASLSSGMMEVARKGIFNPGMFSFDDVIVIFVAVMLADILLLDTFNTFGMPTSTTVSIVFELLGAAVAVSLFAIMTGTEGFSALGDYINVDSAIAIVSGIVLSVGIAFTVGALVQFVSRLIFTFQGTENGDRQWTTLIWSALAVTIISFFILLKGLSGAAFIDAGIRNAIGENVLAVAGAVFAAALVLFWFLQNRLGIDLLKVIVLIGTFSLALAFAGNDLVNFIGVPLAGLASFESWSGSGAAPTAYSMESLAEPVRGQTGFLVIAGLVMVVTLWISEKARSVTETEIRLGRQHEGVERFRPHWLSRVLVKAGIGLGRLSLWLFPRQSVRWMNERYSASSGQPAAIAGEVPAFDLVRASVNLTVASILIAFATTLQLPLSTTYVTFMVAMGTSLADRAWGRDSAVYRVAGVVNVIGGWFATAIVAFTVAGLYAVLLKLFGGPALLVLLAIGVFALVHSHRYHGRRRTVSTIDDNDSSSAAATVRETEDVLDGALNGLASRKARPFDNAARALGHLNYRLQALEIRLVDELERATDNDRIDELRRRLDLFALEKDLHASALRVLSASREYVQNAHPHLQAEQRNWIGRLSSALDEFVERRSSRDRGSDADADAIVEQLRGAIDDQIEGLRNRSYSPKNSRLLLNVYLDLRRIVDTVDEMTGSDLFLRESIGSEARPRSDDRAATEGSAPQPAGGR